MSTKAKKTPPDPEELRAAIRVIEEHSRFNAAALQDLLRASRGLRVTRRFTADAEGRISMLGISTEGASLYDALDLWARKARRQLLQGA